MNLKEYILSHRIIDGDCWIWDDKKNSDGYGMSSIKECGVYNRVSRISASIWLDFDIDSNLCVLHKCDTRSCFRPAHLFIGTRGVNNTDRKLKLRSAYGLDGGGGKLSTEQINEIRKLYELGNNQYDIAKRFEISQSYVSQIIRFKYRKVK